MRILRLLAVIITFSVASWAQVGLRMPVVSAGPTSGKIQWTAGTVNNGGHAVTIAAANLSLDASMASCAAPTYATCDFLYSNNTGTVALTQTAATAIAAGNTLLALIETNGSSVPTRIVSPLQSSTVANLAASAAASLATPVTAVNGGMGADVSGNTGIALDTTGTFTFLSSSGTGNVARVGSPVLTTPSITQINDANGAAFIKSSATGTAVDGIQVTTAATANPATVTVLSQGSDSNVNLALNAKGTGTVQASTFLQTSSNKAVLTGADWTCGTGGTSDPCTAATIVGTGVVPLTLTLPLQAITWNWECVGVVGQATAATANTWGIITATNGATNIEANYLMNTAATAMSGGAITGVAAATTSTAITPTWTLGATGTKMPFRIYGTIEGSSTSGSVLSLTVINAAAGDLMTIYRGAYCRIF